MTATANVTVTVTVTSEMKALIRERVRSGRYADETAVLDAALRLLEERDKLEYLRALIDEADAEVARGELVEWTPDFMEQVWQEALEANRRGDPIDDAVLP